MSNLNDPPDPFSAETMHKCADKVKSLRVKDFLMNIDDAGSDVNAEQYYLLGLSALEQAQRFFTLAGNAQAAATYNRSS